MFSNFSYIRLAIYEEFAWVASWQIWMRVVKFIFMAIFVIFTFLPATTFLVIAIAFGWFTTTSEFVGLDNDAKHTAELINALLVLVTGVVWPFLWTLLWVRILHRYVRIKNQANQTVENCWR